MRAKRRGESEASVKRSLSEDLLIGHTADLELFQWFVRAHLKDSSGDVMHRETNGA